jgi:hypothetical protein
MAKAGFASCATSQIRPSVDGGIHLRAIHHQRNMRRHPADVVSEPCFQKVFWRRLSAVLVLPANKRDASGGMLRTMVLYPLMGDGPQGRMTAGVIVRLYNRLATGFAKLGSTASCATRACHVPDGGRACAGRGSAFCLSSPTADLVTCTSGHIAQDGRLAHLSGEWCRRICCHPGILVDPYFPARWTMGGPAGTVS